MESFNSEDFCCCWTETFTSPWECWSMRISADILPWAVCFWQAQAENQKHSADSYSLCSEPETMPASSSTCSEHIAAVFVLNIPTINASHLHSLLQTLLQLSDFLDDFLLFLCWTFVQKKLSVLEVEQHHHRQRQQVAALKNPWLGLLILVKLTFFFFCNITNLKVTLRPVWVTFWYQVSILLSIYFCLSCFIVSNRKMLQIH